MLKEGNEALVPRHFYFCFVDSVSEFMLMLIFIDELESSAH